MRKLLGILMGMVVGLGACGESKPTEPKIEDLLVGVWLHRSFDEPSNQFVSLTLTLYETFSYKRVVLYEDDFAGFTQKGEWRPEGQLQLQFNEQEVTFNESWIDIFGEPPYDDDFGVPRGEFTRDYTLSENNLVIVTDLGFNRSFSRQ